MLKLMLDFNPKNRSEADVLLWHPFLKEEE